MDNRLNTISDLDSLEFPPAINCNVEEFHNHFQIKRNDFTIISQNIRSVYSNLDDFITNLTPLKFTPDVIILTECRLQREVPIPKVNNYSGEHTTAYINQNDGVVAYTKDSLKMKVREVNLQDASCLQIDYQNHIVLGVYRSPSVINATPFIDSLSSHLETIKSNKTIVVTGDINIDLIEQVNEPAYKRNNRHNYLNMLASFGITMGHNLPTRLEGCLDHFMIKLNNNSSTTAQIAVLNTSITDHVMIALALSHIKTNTVAPTVRKVIDYNEALQSLKKKDLSKLLLCTNPNLLLNQLIKSISDSLLENTKTSHIPKSKRILKPWITPGVLRCIRNRNKMQLKVRKNPNDVTLAIIFRRYRNFCNQLIKKLKRTYERNLLHSSAKNPKNLWKNIAEITNHKQNKSDNTHLLSIKQGPKESVDYINKHFANIGKELASRISQTSNSTVDRGSVLTHFSQPNSFVLMDTDTEEVESILMSLKSSSAPGWDSIPTHFLKLAKNEIVPVLTHIINQCFAVGVFPDSLKKAIVTPVFKSGDRDSISNYRPISVLSVFSKIIEKIMNKRLVSYLNKYNIISERQFGFRQNKSTEDAILTLSTTLVEQLDKGNKCLTAFLDLKNAFDTVSVPILLQKLEQIGIRGIPLKLFTDYLTKRSQCVKVGLHISESSSIDFGVPQGSVLGPTLFLIYINDLLNLQLTNANIISYADDTAIIFSGKTWQSVSVDTHKGLTNVDTWLKQNLLTLNSLKTKYMCYTINKSTQPPQDFSISIHHPNCTDSNIFSCTCPKIEKTSSIKYLGVMLDQHLTWHSHIETTAGRLRRLIWIFVKLRHVASKSLLNTIYIALAQSVLTYCITVWGGATKTKFLDVEIAQRALLKVAYFKPKMHPTTKLYLDCNLLTVRKLYILHSILKLHKTLTPNPSYLLKRRKVAIVTTGTGVRTVFASRQYNNESKRIYNLVNKEIDFYLLPKFTCKKLITAWLKEKDYEEIEKLFERVV